MTSNTRVFFVAVTLYMGVVHVHGVCWKICVFMN